MQALRDSFRETPNVDFAGTYRLYEPGVTHQQRIKSLTHEIWEVTGYRFTYASFCPLILVPFPN